MGDSLVTAGILAVVALSEGIRLVPPGSLVLERPRGRWRVARTFELGSGLHLVSWCIPCTLPAVLPPAPLGDTRNDAERVRERIAAIDGHVIALRLVGAAILVVLVGGLPYSASRWSGIGLLGALALLILLCVTQVLVTRHALRRLGEGSGAWRMLWPFSAPRAPQLVQERALAGFSPLLAAQTLLPGDDLLHAMRATVYDAVAFGNASGARDLLALYPRDELQRFIWSPLSTEGYPYCPRCASVYRVGTELCADCESISLMNATAVTRT